MKQITDFPKLPESIQVEVSKGTSGSLIAELPEFDIYTEAEDPNDLFFQVNDLISTYFDIPKKYQEKINFVPCLEAREKIIKVGSKKTTNSYSELQFKTFYTPDVVKFLS